MVQGESPPFQILTSADQLMATLCYANKALALGSVEEILAAIRKLALKPAIEAEALKQLLDEAPGEAEGPGEVCVARGTPPKPAVDSVLKWTGEFFAPGYFIDPDNDRMDFKVRAEQPEVAPGQLLATLTAAVDGEPGVDIFGRRLRAERARRIRVKPSAGARAEEGTGVTLFFAAIAGRVRYDNDAITVDQTLTIHGNVDMGTGHIHHNGAVEVQGDVNPGFRIEADGDVLIRGTVDQADIICGGSLEVQLGISGAAGKTIRARGHVKALYLSDAALEAEGDVCVENEIVHSCVKTTGALLMPHGRVAGGAIEASGGMLLGDAGSEHGTPTRLIAGRNARLEAAIAAQQLEAGRHEDNLKKLNDGLLRVQRFEASMSPAQHDALAKLMLQIGETEAAAVECRNQIADLKQQIAATCHPTIQINGALYPETEIHLGAFRRTSQETLNGPLMARIFSRDVIFKPVEPPGVKRPGEGNQKAAPQADKILR